MLQSMTGYGQARKETEALNVNAEVKSLNSKGFDAILRLPHEFSHKEPAVRSMLYNQLARGKVHCTITLQYLNPELIKQNINHELVELYHQEFKALSNKLGLDQEGMFRTLLNMPNVLQSNENTDYEQHWEVIEPLIREAIENLIAFRKQEGTNLKAQLQKYIGQIREIKDSVKAKSEQKPQEIRDKLNAQLQHLEEQYGDQIDTNRFEQEVIYYIEKLDVTEELDRLDSHIDYFYELLESEESGKKLNFISQELGREINTIGSKANDATIQHEVVSMKEALEKIKEQVQNIV